MEPMIERNAVTLESDSLCSATAISLRSRLILEIGQCSYFFELGSQVAFLEVFYE